MNFSQIAACNLSSDDLLLAFGKAEATVDRDVVSSVYSIALVCITIWLQCKQINKQSS